MPHLTTGTIQSLIGPIFADPDVRACLSPQECSHVDAILQKDELTKRDRRCLARAVEDVLMHEDGDA